MRVIVSTYNVARYREGGGHFWVYMQYVLGLRSLGCDVWWLEEFRESGDAESDRDAVSTMSRRLARYGLPGKLILYSGDGRYVGLSKEFVEDVFRSSDLLLNFHQRIGAWILDKFRLTALVDIDPGLLQFWIGSRQISVAPHDLYFTTGETVGTPQAKFPDCGLNWIPIRPAVSLDCWPYITAVERPVFCTVSTWWGKEWIASGQESYDNNKRAEFLRFIELPRFTHQTLELAINSGDDDRDDVEALRRAGWRIRHSREVATTPEEYQRYIQSSFGEFSCAKPSCVRFQNAWISDRSLCYLASGRPIVVQDTGPSRILPSGLGMFRFSTLEEAAAYLNEAASDFDRHSRAARELAEAIFDARRVAETILRSAATGCPLGRERFAEPSEPTDDHALTNEAERKPPV
jgi:hypothetical protein